MGALVREIVPGATAQNFYAVKPVSSSDVMTAEQVAAVQAAELQLREERAQAGAETDRTGAPQRLTARAAYHLGRRALAGAAAAGLTGRRAQPSRRLIGLAIAVVVEVVADLCAR